METGFETEVELAAVFLVGLVPGVGEGLAGFDVDPLGGVLWEGGEAAAFVDEDFEGFGVFVVAAGVVEQVAALLLTQVSHGLGDVVELLGQ
ncbi:hypothetical protein [Kitasatospora sp. SUK 42]|uniref:hypothetical protein n=1 Tax=Kitasatospora sp. SUK 42 TaxID=1588882 RepID=UPI0018CB5D5A|nr:hypothetical protein [Kitasatospora sp. SUK 42]MBV2153184.1 hypothetical protein [Kitasatospora sp. SUK 42]